MTKYGAYLAIFGAIITVILNLILVPSFGYVGSAWATLICYFAMTLLSFYWGQKYYRVPYYLLNAGFYFTFALILYFLSVYFRPDSQKLVYLLNTGYLILFIAVFVVKERAWELIKKK